MSLVKPAIIHGEHSPEIEEIIKRLSKEYDINLTICREAVWNMFNVLKSQIRNKTLVSVRFLRLGTWGVSNNKYNKYKKLWGV